MLGFSKLYGVAGVSVCVSDCVCIVFHPCHTQKMLTSLWYMSHKKTKGSQKLKRVHRDQMGHAQLFCECVRCVCVCVCVCLVL